MCAWCLDACVKAEWVNFLVASACSSALGEGLCCWLGPTRSTAAILAIWLPVLSKPDELNELASLACRLEALPSVHVQRMV